MFDPHSRPQRPRSFWSASGIATSSLVQQRKSAILGLPVTLRMLRVKSDKSDWFWPHSIVFTKPFKTGMSLDRARGRDSWCWPKGARPLGTRMVWPTLVPRGRAPFGQHQESRPLAVSNNGSPRSTDFLSLCACFGSSLTNLIGSGLNLLCLQIHSKPECRWTWPEVAILGADQKERGLWGREWVWPCTQICWRMYDWNIFRSCSVVSESKAFAQLTFGEFSEILGKWSKILGKSSQPSLYVLVMCVSKQLLDELGWAWYH